MKSLASLPTLFVAILLVASCGINEKENAALVQAQKALLADSIASYTSLLSREQNLLINSRASLYTANDQMNQIKAFHFGRLPAERESQIRNQEVVIQSLEMQEGNIQSAIQQTQASLDHLKSELTGIQ